VGERDHSVKCETCGVQRGGLNDLRCYCDVGEPPPPRIWPATYEQADSARALIDALIYPKRDFDHAWDEATLRWGRYGEVPAKIAILESAVLEACEIARRGKVSDPADIERLKALQLLVSG
jgi:hypothetical protein